MIRLKMKNQLNIEYYLITLQGDIALEFIKALTLQEENRFLDALKFL